ncbi:type II toxin-antitoxin system VapC family toxin [Sphingomonas sp. AOB5]|uniref:type II toxin-antitoxin system VapC family toxin n=1 Tax=Sphingomonas sp. AOB5 TaxID=3034017 RepID=UPI0023F871E2|nr:type II toxin-antitoxin system VapC family toxin [Sphingomonas sp. AOB5]MDF7776511.1 type II toxin-antitoxin system VapC family toxin [Sphingomonas sp. AOB5]
MADRFLLDSNICIYALRGLSETLKVRLAEQVEGSLFVSTISLAEISVGYGEAVFDAPDLAAFLEKVAVLPFDAHAAMLHGTLPFRRSRLDRLIAAHALSLDLILITNNERDVADIPGLKIENWTL